MSNQTETKKMPPHMNSDILPMLRERRGLEEDDPSHDDEISKYTPLQVVRACAGWRLGDPGWADTFLDWMEAAGYEITTRP